MWMVATPHLYVSIHRIIFDTHHGMKIRSCSAPCRASPKRLPAVGEYLRIGQRRILVSEFLPRLDRHSLTFAVTGAPPRSVCTNSGPRSLLAFPSRGPRLGWSAPHRSLFTSTFASILCPRRRALIHSPLRSCSLPRPGYALSVSSASASTFFTFSIVCAAHVRSNLSTYPFTVADCPWSFPMHFSAVKLRICDA